MSNWETIAGGPRLDSLDTDSTQWYCQQYLANPNSREWDSGSFAEWDSGSFARRLTDIQEYLKEFLPPHKVDWDMQSNGTLFIRLHFYTVSLMGSSIEPDDEQHIIALPLSKTLFRSFSAHEKKELLCAALVALTTQQKFEIYLVQDYVHNKALKKETMTDVRERIKECTRPAAIESGLDTGSESVSEASSGELAEHEECVDGAGEKTILPESES